MLESELQASILKYLKTKPCYVVKNIRSNCKGQPDIFICYKGYFIFVEVKSPRRPVQLTPTQEVRINQLIAEGARGMVVNRLEEFIIKFDEIVDEIESREVSLTIH